MKTISLLFIAIILATASCTGPGPTAPDQVKEVSTSNIPLLTFREENIFPSDRTLSHPEDGFALEDGRVVVTDDRFGLSVIEADGSHRPFGNFKEAGFVNDPEVMAAAPNGVILESDGKHALMADVLTGKIYRIEIESETVEVIYDHGFGVNTLCRDRTGAIWFTQSTNNSEGPADPGWLRDVDTRSANGAVYRLGHSETGFDDRAVLIRDGLYFANGITLDAAEENLYVAETTLDRVMRYPVDIENGTASEPELYASITTPDNLRFDREGRLWVASPALNQVVMIDEKNRSQHVVFDASTESTWRVLTEWKRRMSTGEPVLELLNPELFSPMPGPLTGFFFSHDHTKLYVTTIGNAIVKCDF